MRTLFITLLLLTSSLSAQDNNQQAPNEYKRVEYITWNLKTHRLEWVMQFGTCKNEKVPGQCRNEDVVVTGERSFSIDPDNAIMTDGKEERGFDLREAANLHRLLDFLAAYGDESFVWWRDGKGKSTKNDVIIAKRPTPPFAFVFKK